MIRKYFIALCLMSGVSHTVTDAAETIWEIGKSDRSAQEFALAPDGFKRFLAEDFGYEDKFFMLGKSVEEKDFPYILPGPADTWGGTWHTAGWRTHQVNVHFGLDKVVAGGGYRLVVSLSDFAKTFLPLVKVSVNAVDYKMQFSWPGYDIASQKKPTLGGEVPASGSLYGDYAAATPYEWTIPLNSEVLRKGGNEIMISVLEGSWILFDQIRLEGPEGTVVSPVDEVFVRAVMPADYLLEKENGKVQPLIVDVEHLSGTPRLKVELDGAEIWSKEVEKGRYQFEVPMPAVASPVQSHYRIWADSRVIAEGSVERTPQELQTLADYVDTRIGTAHSRWMIAPGPWMPFGMVKMSPDNQNMGWQSGYQPSIENIACFSHIHEWTMGGLGVMPANGRLQVRPGDELKPDEGYRSRIDKRSEEAGIGRYGVNLTDYGIKAEITATTRCGLERFTFPADRKDNRILIELHPQTEYDFTLHDVSVTQVNEYRIEGSCRQYSPQVWSNDAEQDYTLHFVLEFDRPVKKMGTWCDEEIRSGVQRLTADSCKEAGLFLSFDTEENAVVQVRSGISLVSIKNASENLETEISRPFGWNFEAVVAEQKRVWNEIFSRITISTDDRLEKVKFYNNMYRAVCSRNVWSDVNGEWVATDGKVRKVADPEKNWMLGCDAFWNTFWNLNQFWNLVLPEWSSRWVRSQLAMYDANSWLAKGPAGLNYIPVMVAEHEIPQMVGTYQMGIRDFDAEKLLEAAVKMQTTPAQKVCKGFAGNRDLRAYMKYGYVPYDKGRFSNTMEYSFDDWTVGQLALALGKESIYNQFNKRGYWWRNVISKEGYCHMKDSKGNWLPDFDPFRSGANQHYVEGNAWQLTFFVPQDVPALVREIGEERFMQRLLWGFERDEAWRYNAPNDQYWDHPVVQGNQQSMHFAFLFNYAGYPWYTQKWSRSILERYYGSGTGNAYLGDEDQGQMSAWAVMASIGLFQIDGGCRVNPEYEIASPSFEKIVIDLGEKYGRGKHFTIRAKNASKNNIYVMQAFLNGKELDSFKFPASELLKGGELILVMGDKPNTKWGVEK